MKKNRNRMKAAMAAATVVGASTTIASAAQIAINFKGDSYGSEFGRDVSVSAFGIAAGDWYTSPAHTATTLDGGFDLATISGVDFSWIFANDWAQSAAYTGTTGEDEVYFGYLDDGGSGADITISGISTWLAANSATSYTLTLIMSSGNSGTPAFQDTPLLDFEGGNLLHTYSIGSGSLGASGGIQGSEVSPSLTSDTLFVDGQTRNGAIRGSIAGIILTTDPVPEPSSTALLGLGAVGLMLRRKRS